MPEPLHTTLEDSGPHAGIAVMRLEQPGKPVVVLDLALIQRIEATVRALPRTVTGLVLASASERVFVAGADLKSISEQDDDQLAKYLAYGQRVFGMLSNLPYPTAAAIHGAALGGGLEIAMHCDALVASPPPTRDGQPGKAYPVGLPEAGLAICPGWGGTNLLPARMDPMKAIRATAMGKTMLFDEAKQDGFFDAVAPDSASLMPTALAWVDSARRRGRVERDGAPSRWIGRPGKAAATLKALDALRASGELSSDSARAVMEAVDAGLARGWSAALEVEIRHLVRLRGLPAGRDAIAAFFAKAGGR